MKGYDSHIFIKAFSALEEKPSGIPENSQKFKMLSLKKWGSSEIKFLDSLEFKKRPLDKLVQELSEYPHLKSHFGPSDFEIFKRKGVFPYEWFDSIEKLKQTEFPPHSAFKGSLNADKNISTDEYKYGKYVYKKFCKNFQDYHDLYMCCDVILLADVMEKFRRLI